MIPVLVTATSAAAERKGLSLSCQGTQTGALQALGREHFTRVTEVSFEENFVKAKGRIAPSSEALSHAACYLALPSINFVAHVHHYEVWNSLLARAPDHCYRSEGRHPGDGARDSRDASEV